MPWTVDNAEERAAEAPGSFFIPAAQLRASLREGDVVKLIFRLERDDGETAVERMWVEVRETDPHVGLLRNVPRLEGVIDLGEEVRFGPEHVCGYAYDPAELGYDPEVPCYLLKRVAEGEAPPALLLLNADDEWEAHAANETDEELENSANVLRWTLGYLTDRFPETEQALREGSRRRSIRRHRGREEWWRWQGDRYARVET